MRIAIPSNRPGGLEATVSPHFGRCEVFTLVEIKDGKIAKVEVMENQGVHSGYGQTPAEILASRGVDAILAQGMGPKAMQLFAQRGIAVYMTSAKTVDEAVKEILEDRAKLASLEDACREAHGFEPPAPAFPPMTGFGMGGGMGRGMGRGLGPFGFPPMPPYPPARPPSPPSGRFKVAVASQGRGGLDDLVSPMFGRAPSFTLVEVEGNEIKGVRVLPNQMISAPSGVGIAITQMLANEGASYLVAGRFGPNATAVAAQFGIQTVMVPPGIKVRDAVLQYVLKSR